PGPVGGNEPGPGDGADPVRQQHDEPAAQSRRARRRQGAKALERRQRPPDAEHGQEDRAGPEHPPQERADAFAPAPGDGKTEQGQPEEQAHDQGADPDELLARLRRHVMRRFAYVGTTPKRSAFAANATSSARSASASWRAASESASASFQLANCSVSASAARAASFSSTLRVPFFATFTSRPAV